MEPSRIHRVAGVIQCRKARRRIRKDTMISPREEQKTNASVGPEKLRDQDLHTLSPTRKKARKIRKSRARSIPELGCFQRWLDDENRRCAEGFRFKLRWLLTRSY